MSAPEAARRLGVQLHTLHGMIDRGELVAEVFPLDQIRRRRAIRVRRQDVDDYIERARVKPGDLHHLHPSWTWVGPRPHKTGDASGITLGLHQA